MARQQQQQQAAGQKWGVDAPVGNAEAHRDRIERLFFVDDVRRNRTGGDVTGFRSDALAALGCRWPKPGPGYLPAWVPSNAPGLEHGT
ncbi:hypothetical protein O1611_g6545 [Lasiodiplodia mahajangana]|uniref:Uncharacterized protein n=1 Tax=Lasiodiplodia mahajangana TaxID=1108764 RepID=A0ACC2JI03_9PEZI|nr:hypothetical protein O1611_g6545 [Lasiodiplodia mahajangana]